VNDVQLPPWCQNDPYMFVIYMREAFESAYVSANLGGWIDYVFGCKQRDLDAERSLNTFSRLTYEDAVDLDAI
jgi:lysosomal-trafficking regulator